MTRQPQYWIDQLVEKHECFPCERCEMRAEKIEVGGEAVEVLVSRWAVQFEVVEAHRASNKLFLILRDIETQGWDDNLGIVAVAVRQPKQVGQYAVVFWHETYPYLWKHLE